MKSCKLEEEEYILFVSMASRELEQTQREPLAGDFFQLTEEGALTILKGLVTENLVAQYSAEGKASGVENPNIARTKIHSLLENECFLKQFKYFWEVEKEALGSTVKKRRVVAFPSEVVRLAKSEGRDAALLHQTVKNALGVAFRGAGVLLDRENVPFGREGNYTKHFRGTEGSRLEEIYGKYLLAVNFFDYVFTKTTRKDDNAAGFKKAA